MERFACRPILLLAGLVATASCTPGVPAPAPPTTPPAAPSAALDASASAPSAAPSASGPESVAAVASAPGPRGPRFVPGTIRCNEKLCKAGKEVCCAYGDEVGCAARVPMGTGRMLEQKLEPQHRACTEQVSSKYSMSSVSYCDDSSDCGANEVCCVNWGPGSGNSHAICVPAARDRSNVCELSESCVEGQPCAIANTHCEGGACVLDNARVRCSGVVCEGATPVCCTLEPETAPVCSSADKCRPTPDSGPFPTANECSGPSSCPRGMLCQRNLFHSYCSGMLDGANARLVCETDKDCPADHCKMWGGKGKPKCVFDTDFSYCTCP